MVVVRRGVQRLAVRLRQELLHSRRQSGLHVFVGHHGDADVLVRRLKLRDVRLVRREVRLRGRAHRGVSLRRRLKRNADLQLDGHRLPRLRVRRRLHAELRRTIVRDQRLPRSRHLRILFGWRDVRSRRWNLQRDRRRFWPPRRPDVDAELHGSRVRTGRRRRDMRNLPSYRMVLQRPRPVRSPGHGLQERVRQPRVRRRHGDVLRGSVLWIAERRVPERTGLHEQRNLHVRARVLRASLRG